MECLHSFCHECIVKTVQPGRGTTNACPTCGIKLGNNPFVEKKVVKDQVKVSIVDKLRASGVLVGSGGGGAAAVEVTAPPVAAAARTRGSSSGGSRTGGCRAGTRGQGPADPAPAQ
jgi:hypothetical protein